MILKIRNFNQIYITKPAPNRSHYETKTFGKSGKKYCKQIYAIKTAVFLKNISDVKKCNFTIMFLHFCHGSLFRIGKNLQARTNKIYKLLSLPPKNCSQNLKITRMKFWGENSKDF